MKQCILKRAKCAGAFFTGIDLEYADFSHADASRARFVGATLSRTRFQRTAMQDTVWGDRSGALGDDEEQAQAEDWASKARPG